ncbi:hypothetical protein H2198_000017 [Neophaeococcomyces mojaviensis]|uniref:Uncharacterized protein n=1 Tax=Neophaeococcomyces mojaviensis TaxID=3383035 RepID=A0ACC3AKS4_9EURO|nr:hypothetical protein H2198_000017 [Knufia sp. JES_112]
MSSDSSKAADKQLKHELHHAVLHSFDAQADRPILKHINADSSWLLSLPYPSHAPPPPGRYRFNILIDAWLRGPQVDLFSWFSSQEHANPSSVQSLNELSGLLEKAEAAVVLPHRDENGQSRAPACFIDAVCCSHEFTDHCHEATLRELPSNVPVFAPSKAASLVRSWKHFTTVVEIPVFKTGFDWRVGSLLPLQKWIGLGRVHTQGDAPIHFHSALVITFSLSSTSQAEAIVYTPHGVTSGSMEIMTTAKPPVKTLALLHGLHDVSLLGARLNLGMENAIKTQKLLSAPYWFRTHDEVKIAKGIVASFLKRAEHTLQIAPGSHPITDPEAQTEFMSEKSFVELGNGESIVLK